MEGACEPALRVHRPVLVCLSAWTEPRTLMIGALTLVAAFTEGTANDWVSVAFVEGYHLPTWAGVLGFATFLSFMTIGRILGTQLLDRYGRVPVLRVMLVVAGFGSLLVVFGRRPWPSSGGHLGRGCLPSASRWDERPPPTTPPGPRLGSRWSPPSAYTAFIAGPPLLGFLGDHFGILRPCSRTGRCWSSPSSSCPRPRARGTTQRPG